MQEIINRNAGKDHGASYRVTILARFSGSRLMRQLPSMDAAEAWATSQNREITENGRRHFALTGQQRDDALEALTLLDGTGLTSTKIAKMARNAYHPPAGGHTVSVAISKLLVEKDGLNLRARPLQDLKNCLTVFGQSFDPFRLLALYAGRQLLRTADGGATWRRSGKTLAPTHLCWHLQRAGTVYAGN